MPQHVSGGQKTTSGVWSSLHRVCPGHGIRVTGGAPLLTAEHLCSLSYGTAPPPRFTWSPCFVIHAGLGLNGLKEPFFCFSLLNSWGYRCGPQHQALESVFLSIPGGSEEPSPAARVWQASLRLLSGGNECLVSLNIGPFLPPQPKG